jgi:hypothetical protein
MMGFWIAVAVSVAGVLGAMCYYAVKARLQARPSRDVETMNARPRRVEQQVEMPRPLGHHTHAPDGLPRELDVRPRGIDGAYGPLADDQVRTERAGRRAR